MLKIKRNIFLLFVLSMLPAVVSADSGKIFRQHSGSVVVVTGYNQKGEALTEGTGFIAGSNGIVVTNFHVVAIASKVKVRSGSTVMNIEGVVHADMEHDLIVLKVPGQHLPAVKLGEPGSLRKGDRVYIISSEGSSNSITEGTFQGMRETSTKGKTLQIASPVTQGSSGSPVLNSDGKAVGIVTFLIRRSQNLILAMPIDLIRDKINRSPQAITPEKTALQKYRKLPEYWFYLGYFLMEAGAHKDAIDVLKEAVKIRPGYSDAHYYLGAAYETTGKDLKAVEAYRKAAKAAPDSSDAYFSLGVTYGRLGRYAEAVTALKEAVRLEKDHADAHYNLGIAYIFLGNKEAASNEYRILKELDPDSAHKLLGTINR